MHRARVGSGAALLGAWALFFAPHLLTSGVPYYRDHLVTNIPLRHFMRERLLSGHLPQWYPYEGLGVPLIGQIALGVFHPFNFLFHPLSAPAGQKWALLASYLAALVGAYRLCRAVGASRPAAVAGGIAYGLGGFALGVSSIIAYAMSLAALPWVGWAALRAARQARPKDAALLGVAWALVFLAGDAIGFLFAGAFALVALWDTPRKRALAALAGGAAIAALLACIELVPATRIAAQAVRNVGTPSPTLGLTWALHPWRIPELVSAGWVPDETRWRVVGELLGGGNNLFATTVFTGATVIALACAGVQRRRVALAFGAIALVGLWLALGDRGGLYLVARKAIPLLQRFRYPERYVVWWAAGVAPLCALGVDRALARPQQVARWALVLAAPMALASALAWAGVLPALAWRTVGRELSDPEVARSVVQAWGTGLGASALALAALGGALLLTVRSPRAAALIPALVFAELLWGNAAHLPLVDPELLVESNPFVEAVRATASGAAPSARVLSEGRPFYPSTVTGPGRELWVAGVKHFMTSTASGLHEVASLHSNLGARQARNALLFGDLEDRTPALGPLFNGCFRVVSEARAVREGEALVASAPELGIKLLQTSCRPRAYLSGAIGVDGPAAALAHTDAFQPGADWVVWEGGPDLAPAAGRVQIARYEPDEVVLDVDASAPAALVLSDEHMPGWTAEVDGAPAAIHPTLVDVRGVEVPAGQHRVVFRYATPGLALGAALTALGALLALGAWAASRRFTSP